MELPCNSSRIINIGKLFRAYSLVAIESGANINFDRLRYVAERTQVGEHREILLAVTIPEKPGSFLTFCKLLGKRNITEFNYRYFDSGSAQIFAGISSSGNETDKTNIIKHRRAMLPHNILGLLSLTFIRLRSEWEMPWSPCVRLNYAQNPAPLRLPQMAGRLFGMQFLPPSRATSALRISKLPCRLPGTKNHHSA